MGVQCAIFERNSIATTTWTSAIAGYLVGYTMTMFILYSLAPILFRLSSAMFYNLSLLTSGTPPLNAIANPDFWGLIIGIRLFGFYVYYLYPVAFCMTVAGSFRVATISDIRADYLLLRRDEPLRRSFETMAGRRGSGRRNCRRRDLQTKICRHQKQRHRNSVGRKLKILLSSTDDSRISRA